ncbi:hypothetical protein N9L68_08365 [bacterium]|nr:hypothetical protein [bacterium]
MCLRLGEGNTARGRGPAGPGSAMGRRGGRRREKSGDVREEESAHESLERIPIASIRPNPGGPRPSLRAAAGQLGDLWPLEEVIAQWLRNWSFNRGVAWQKMVVGLLHTMLREGCTGWKADAGHM